jgi:hypothetical protein
MGQKAFYAGLFGGFLLYMGTENWWLTAFAFLISASLAMIALRV